MPDPAVLALAQQVLDFALDTHQADGHGLHAGAVEAVIEAATKLHTATVENDRISNSYPREEALLRLLGAVAWAQARRAHRGEALGPGDADDLIDRELGPRADRIGRDLLGVLSAEADPNAELGHLRAGLIARHWRAQLTADPFGADEERALLGARLLADEGLDALLDRLRREPDAVRRRVAERAEGLFMDERLASHRGPVSEPRQDERWQLREAALAVRCHLGDTPLVLTDPGPLLSLAGLAAMAGEVARVDAPGIILKGLKFFAIPLPHARLRGAHLEGAYLRGANLDGADLRGAQLGRAHLAGADLAGADLEGADLGRANLRRANLRGGNLRRVNLADAHLAGADLAGADLAGANLTGADLGRAHLAGANLRQADLAGADLRTAHLGAGPERVRALRRTRHLDEAVLPDGFAFEPEDGPA